MLHKLLVSINGIRSDIMKFHEVCFFFCLFMLFPRLLFVLFCSYFLFLLTHWIAWQQNCIIFIGFYGCWNTFKIFWIWCKIIVGLYSNNIINPNQNNHHVNIVHRKLAFDETHFFNRSCVFKSNVMSIYWIYISVALLLA